MKQMLINQKEVGNEKLHTFIMKRCYTLIILDYNFISYAHGQASRAPSILIACVSKHVLSIFAENFRAHLYIFVHVKLLFSSSLSSIVLEVAI
jgi:hypothetical protein